MKAKLYLAVMVACLGYLLAVLGVFTVRHSFDSPKPAPATTTTTAVSPQVAAPAVRTTPPTATRAGIRPDTTTSTQPPSTTTTPPPAPPPTTCVLVICTQGHQL